jgi:hypothetical protein
VSCETRIIRGRRVMVVRTRKFLSAAPAMAARGWSRRKICAALRVSPERVALVLAAPVSASVWGEFAGMIAEEMRRAA